MQLSITHRLQFIIKLMMFFSALTLSFSSFAEEKFLPVDEAFVFSAQQADKNTVAVNFEIKENHYLYKDRLKFDIQFKNNEKSDLTISSPVLPKAEIKDDQFFGKVEIYKHNLKFDIPLNHNDGKTQNVVLSIKYQGCAAAGLCYPPQEKLVVLNPSGSRPVDQAEGNETDKISKVLKESSLFVALLTFFGFGLLLSFTPCVLPMIPILSGLILGQKEQLTKTKGLLLSGSYVLGMAITYSLAGVAAASAGQLLSNYLQNVWVMSFFALVFVALALSMFGLYELQLPSSLQTKFSQMGQGGSSRNKMLSLAFMGAVSALIVGPCVAAPLAGALLYISKTGNTVLGGLALFSMALGMGVPLLLVGVSAGSLLPKTGTWMVRVKYVFGVILLGTAFWLVSPFILGGNTEQHGDFKVIHTQNEFEQNTKSAEKITMVDFYADWCVACKEFEKFTFSDPAVEKKLKAFNLIKIDITDNKPEHQLLLKKFGIFGPPAILFFDQNGKEIESMRIIGFKNAEAFTKVIDSAPK